MKAIGTRPFATLATDSNPAIFYKCFANICEAKVAYAQLTTASKPERALPTKLKYTAMKLKILYALAVKLPSPLALFVESIGNFTADAQPVTPVRWIIKCLTHHLTYQR